MWKPKTLENHCQSDNTELEGLKQGRSKRWVCPVHAAHATVAMAPPSFALPSSPNPPYYFGPPLPACSVPPPKAAIFSLHPTCSVPPPGHHFPAAFFLSPCFSYHRRLLLCLCLIWFTRLGCGVCTCTSRGLLQPGTFAPVHPAWCGCLQLYSCQSRGAHNHAGWTGEGRSSLWMGQRAGEPPPPPKLVTRWHATAPVAPFKDQPWAQWSKSA